MAAGALSLQNVSKKEAIEYAEDEHKKAVSWQKRFNKVKEKGAVVAQRVMAAGLTVGAGAAMGFLDAKYPGKWMNVDKEIWIGVPLVLLGLTGLAGPKATNALLHAGGGVLSVYAYRNVKARVG